jgi:hypothetical protein
MVLRRELVFSAYGTCNHRVVFIVPLRGLELHAASLNESRTYGSCLVTRTGNPGISLVFLEMWDPTDVDR